MQSWNYLWDMFTTNFTSNLGMEVFYYRPFFWLWVLLINTMSGLSPWVWHLSSILLHILATWLVFQLCREFLGNELSATFAAGLFALHPIHVDAVSWVSASNEVLFTIFTLSSLILLHKNLNDRPTASRHVFSVLLYAAALLTKETAVAVLPVLFGFALLGTDKRNGWWARLRETLRTTAGYCVATVLYFLVRWVVLPQPTLRTAKHSWQEVFYSAPSILVFYLKKLVLPIHLSGFYVNPLISSPTLSMWLMLAVLIAVVALLIWLAVRYNRVVGIAAALIFFPLLTTLAAVRVYPQGDMTHDRYLYLPSVGFCLLIGVLATWLWGRPKTQPVLVTSIALLGCVFAYLTIVQQRFYKDDEAFYTRGIEVDPSNALVTSFLGNTYLQNGQPDRALELLDKASRLAPNDPTIRFYLARGLYETRHYAEAEPLLTETSQSPALRYNQGQLLLALANTKINLSKTGEAEQVLRQLEQVDPAYRGLHRTLGILFHRQGRLVEAQAEYAKEYRASGDVEAGRQAAALARMLGHSQ